ncbi:lysosomal protective protein-like [Diadema antillarum]|uniref:lysosomal protective protein-like n=1 Tax=Diadema antillarum TaxID=105358 RepID=UPI003A89C292
MKRVILFCVFTSAALAAYAPDKVTKLPGIPSGAPAFNQYSGYLNATGDKKLHYWFVESQSQPATDPLILWLNGGPGCSSLDGFLSELGPFHVNNDGATLYVNEYSWNKQANVIFLESPAGVGFSYSPSMDIATNDDKVAQDNYIALQDFFLKFPEYVNNSFYLAGESYAGVYIPTLAMLVVNDSSIKLEGFAIGNGLLNMTVNMNSAVYFAYYHSLIDQGLWDRLQTYCCLGSYCQFFNSTNTKCKQAYDEMATLVYDSGINAYSIYTDCAGGIPVQMKRYEFDMKSALKMGYDVQPKSYRKLKGLQGTTHYKSHGFSFTDPKDIGSNIDPCIDVTAETTYLSRKDVREALHIPDSVPAWQVCSDAVEGNYTRVYQTVAPQFTSLLGQSQLRALVYNGDVDVVCNFLADQWFMKDLQLTEVNPRRPWKVDNQVAGFVHQFSNASFVTVKGAGHMVPQWRPAQSYHMIMQFLSNQPL